MSLLPDVLQRLAASGIGQRHVRSIDREASHLRQQIEELVLLVHDLLIAGDLRAAQRIDQQAEAVVGLVGSVVGVTTAAAAQVAAHEVRGQGDAADRRGAIDAGHRP